MNAAAGRRSWGIYRERAHSPGRESDDAGILQAVAQRLSEHGFDVELKAPEDLAALPEDSDALPSLFFVMCERDAIVSRLAAWEKRGARVVNRPAAIRNTDRESTIARLSGDGIPFPSSVLAPTAGPAAVPPFGFPCWVKRGDVHATQAEDVSFAARPAELASRLSALASRGIARAVVQEHVAGDLIKFYGVAGTDAGGQPLSWFQWFYHRDQKLANHAFDPARLRATVAAAAAALGLDVFGGDAIATASGTTCLIDLNAWPSFALYREIAAEKIAARLAERFGQATLDAPLRMETQ